MKYVFSSLLALLICLPSFSQTGKKYFLIDSVNYETRSSDDKAMLDSLLPEYHKAKTDTSRLKVLEMLSQEFNDAALWIQYTRILYAQTKEKLNNTKGLSTKEAVLYNRCYAKALHNLGYYTFTYEEDTEKSIAFHDSCLSMAKKIDDKELVSATYNDIALIYHSQGNIPVALDYFLKSLKIDEEIGDKGNIASSLNNIGNMYLRQKDTVNAIRYFEKSISLCTEAKFYRGLVYPMINIGGIYRDQKKYFKALEYFQHSLPISEKIQDKQSEGIALLSIGLVYQKQLESMGKSEINHGPYFKLSMDYFNKAVKIYEELNNKQGLARTFSSIGNSYLAENDLAKAIEYGKQALKYAQEIGYPANIRDASQLLYKAYNRQGKWQDALTMHELYIQMRDSIFSEETQTSTFKQQAKYEYEKQEVLKNAEHQKELALAEEGKKRQQIVSYATGLGLFMVIVFSIFIFNRLRITRKQKIIIEDQKKIVDQKNNHITYSINYAKRIQDAILPSREELLRIFPNHFIFFQPRDIVSGDFYWLSSINDQTIIAVADCTGHGVPGALMSMIGNTLLNEIVNEKKICQPAEILNHLNDGIVHALHQKSRSQDDGMDISVCLFEKDKSKITFAGANQSLYIVSANSTEEIKGDIYSIGSSFGKKDFLFSQKERLLKKGTCLFLSTDGFADQRGGEEGKKFSTKLLTRLFMDLSAIDGEQQENHVRNTFNKWKGKYPQIDDVLVMGIKT